MFEPALCSRAECDCPFVFIVYCVHSSHMHFMRMLFPFFAAFLSESFIGGMGCSHDYLFFSCVFSDFFVCEFIGLMVGNRSLHLILYLSISRSIIGHFVIFIQWTGVDDGNKLTIMSILWAHVIDAIYSCTCGCGSDWIQDKAFTSK